MSNNKIINWWLLPDNIWIQANSYYWDFQLDTGLEIVTNMNTFVNNVVLNVREFFDPFDSGEEELDGEENILSMRKILPDGPDVYKQYTKIADFEKDLRAFTQLTSLEIQMESSKDSPNFATTILRNTGSMAGWK